jgi:predicted ArsR family transcriptional regulator
MLTDPAPGPALGLSRSRVLSALTDANAALSAEDVAERVDLHVNTVRFHLDALVEAGMAERASERRTRPGRPRTLYAASPDAPRAGERSYRLLAQILAGYLSAKSEQPAADARAAGEVWGRYLAERPAPFAQIDARAATAQLVDALAEVGFAPEARSADGDGGTAQVLLHHCPFREVAERHREVVCSVHLGLMQGLLDELDAPVTTPRLDAFVEPDLCIAHLAPRTTKRSGRARRTV